MHIYVLMFKKSDHTIRQTFHVYPGWVMVFNATFNNISVISWRTVLWMEKAGLPEENHFPVAIH
jgi:hypothetical protein